MDKNQKKYKKLPDPAAPPSSPGAVVGKMKGKQTSSGNLDGEIEASGSFEPQPSSSSAAAPATLGVERSSSWALDSSRNNSNRNDGSSFRSRSNTAPPGLVEKELRKQQKQQQNDGENNKDSSQEAATTSSKADEVKKNDTTVVEKEQQQLVVSTTSTTTAASSLISDVPSEDDDEIRLAKAMAQAIQSNPNMTPDEIHKLIGASAATTSTQQQQQMFPGITNFITAATEAVTTAVPAAAPAAINTMMNSSISNISAAVNAEIKPSSSSSSDGGGGNNNKKSKRAFRFDGKRGLERARGLLTGTSTTTKATAKNNNSPAAAQAMSSLSTDFSAEQEESTTGDNGGGGGSAGSATGINMEVSSVASVATSSTTEKSGGGGLRLPFRQTKAAPRSAPVSPNINTSTATTVITSNTTTMMPMPSMMNNNAPPNDATTTIKMSRSLDETEIKQVATTASAGSPVVPAVQQPMEVVPSSFVSSTTATTGGDAASASILGSLQQSITDKAASPATPTAATTTTNAVSSGPIRLSGLAWKRRGGMGKYSSSGAWERRRIELQGSRLLYYQEDDPSTTANTPMGSPSNDSLAAAGLEEVDEGLLVQKRTTWLEQAWTTAAATATAAGAGTALGAATNAGGAGAAVDDPTAPRGYMDLTKEKATVQASWGHSGAPSPFAISIKKPGGETKWKFCFDYHKDQMEWLAALTDAVVQNSVDSYNQLLLEAADPSNQYTITDTNLTAAAAAAAILHPNLSVASPPGTLKTAHQLWTMGSYCIAYPPNLDLVAAAKGMAATSYHSNNESSETNSYGVEDRSVLQSTSIAEEAGAVDVSEQTGEDYSEVEDDVDEEADVAAQAAAIETAAKSLVLPEQNMAFAVAVLNTALGLCRSSSTSMEGFWYVVALANAAMFMLTVQQPHWKSLVKYVRAVRLPSISSSSPLAESSTQQVATSVTKSSQKEKSVKRAASKPPGSVKGKKKKAPGYLPLAGSTAIKLVNTDDKPANSKGEMFAGWRCPSGDTLQVRSHGYASTKQKVASPGDLYECARVDVFESPSRYPDMAKRVQLPKVELKDDGPKTWRTPDIIVISIALPTDPPKLGRSSSDGGGYTITMYCTMKQETRDILRRVTADGYDPSKDNAVNGGDPQKNKVNAVRLLEEWCRRAPNDPSWFSRFKVVPNAHNLKEIGMPSWISKYNGKPFLIKRPGVTGFLHQHPEISCLEFDISIHPFPYLAKQAICFMKESYFKRVLVTFGFVIEGKTDDELPECIIAAMQLCYPDPAYAIMADTFFAGTCHSSFD